MTSTPLSDLMAEHADTNSAETYGRFVALFLESVVGIVGVQQPGAGMAAGRTTYGDGQARLLTFADPEVAAQAPGSQCNAGIPGRVLLEMAAADPDCVGILVNCATRPTSIIISKATAVAALSQGSQPE